MYTWINERINNEKGFTLIELMVVVLIIAILIAIAIPTFLGARRRAQDRQAQSNLRNGLTAEKTYYADAQVYVTDAAGDLKAIESNLDYSTTDAAARGVVPAINTGAQAVYLKSLSKSGTMFCILDVVQLLGTAYKGVTQPGTYYQKNALGGECNDVTLDWKSTSTAGW